MNKTIKIIVGIVVGSAALVGAAFGVKKMIEEYKTPRLKCNDELEDILPTEEELVK